MFAKKARKKVCEQQIHDRYSSQPQNMHQNANNGELKSHIFLLVLLLAEKKGMHGQCKSIWRVCQMPTFKASGTGTTYRQVSYLMKKILLAPIFYHARL